jgi:hypothetical protein
MSKMRLFGDHRIQGEQLVSLAVMRVARCADPHPHHVHDLLDQRARIGGCVHREQRAHQLHQVSAGKRGLVDVRDHAR